MKGLKAYSYFHVAYRLLLEKYVDWHDSCHCKAGIDKWGKKCKTKSYISVSGEFTLKNVDCTVNRVCQLLCLQNLLLIAGSKIVQIFRV